MKRFILLLYLSITASLLAVPTLSLSANDEIVESSIDNAASDLKPDPSIVKSAQKIDLIDIAIRLGSGLLVALVAFVAAIAIGPVKHWFYGPKLKLEFIEDNKDYNTDTQVTITKKNGDGVDVDVSDVPAHYVRIKVVNEGREIAKQCNAYLTNIEKWNYSANKYEQTDYCDSLMLAWSARNIERFRLLNLPKGIKWFVDVISTNAIDKNEYSVETNIEMNRYIDLFKERGKFQYTVMISGDNVKPASCKIVFTWSGDWDNFDVKNG